MKRVWTVLLVCVLLICSFPIASAAEKEIILLAGSDFQTSGYSTQNVERVLDTLAIHGINKADGVFFCGDYTLNAMESNTSTTGVQALKRLFTPIVGNNMIFVQGNHDHEETLGLARAGNNDPGNGKYGVFVIREDQYREWGNDRKVTEEVAKNLRTYLEQKRRAGWNRPIFVLCHIPLHWSNRTIKDGSGTDADVLFDVLEEYGKKGMNIFYLYGHNHSGGYDDFMGGGAVYLKKGDTMEVCHGVKREHKTRTLSFTYMNAGFIGYYSTNQEDCDDTITMSVFRIKGNEVIVTRYSGDFNMTDMGIHNLKSKGILHPDYSQEGYHAVPDTRVYASSRKVTATDDVPVDTPIPQETTTTTEATTTTTTRGSAIAVQKTTDNKVTSTTGKKTNVTDSTGVKPSASDNDGENLSEHNTTEKDVVAHSTTAKNSTTEDAVATDTPTEEDVTDATPIPEDTVTDIPDSVPAESSATPGWVWIFPLVGGAVLIGSIVALVLTSRKKKAQ